MKSAKKASSLALAIVFLGLTVSCSADKNKGTDLT
jgi:hypothetical protein